MKAGKDDEPMWVEAHDRRLSIRGLAWVKENGKRFNRLPLRAEMIVRPPVWDLARCPSSARVCFATDATKLAARATLGSYDPMPHMPLTGQSGLSLFCGEPFRMVPWSVGFPEMGKPVYERVLFDGIAKRMREFTLYLPLYGYLEKLELGFSRGARFRKLSPPVIPEPVVVYGTSITQGGCATTTGADYVSTLGRILNLNVVNLGFSGNGICDPEVAELMCEIDAAMYIFCSLANTPVTELPKKLPPFYRILRRKRPTTPVVLLSKTSYASADHSREVLTRQEAYRDILIHFYSKMRRAGDRHIHFVDGEALIPFGASCAHVDGSHPADHGFQMMAERLAPFVRKILFADCLVQKGMMDYPIPDRAW